MIKKLSGSVLILGSQILDSEDDCKEVDERLTVLFPYNIEINLERMSGLFGSFSMLSSTGETRGTKGKGK